MHVRGVETGRNGLTPLMHMHTLFNTLSCLIEGRLFVSFLCPGPGFLSLYLWSLMCVNYTQSST